MIWELTERQRRYIQGRLKLRELNSKAATGNLTQEEVVMRNALVDYVGGLTSEQWFFLLGRARLAKYEEMEELSPKDKHDVDSIKEKLYQKIVLYASSLAHQGMSMHRLSSDAYSDVNQDMSLKFYEMLPRYDPTYRTPTTYFKPYFLEAISKYKRSYSQHLKQNDSNNLGKIRAAVRDFESRNITYDECMLAAKTGLSPKVVKNTLRIARNTTYLDIDDPENVFVQNASSKLPQPETQYIEQEQIKILEKAIQETLTPEETEFLRQKVDFDSDKDLTHTQIAELFDISIHQAKSTWSSICQKLQNNKELQAYFHREDNLNPVLNTHDDSSNEMEDTMIDYFSDPDLY